MQRPPRRTVLPSPRITGEPEIGAPATAASSRAARIRTWNVEDDRDGLYAGIWEATPGEWRIVYAEWEFFHISRAVPCSPEEGGEAGTLTAGDAFVIRPGFKGTWRVDRDDGEALRHPDLIEAAEKGTPSRPVGQGRGARGGRLVGWTALALDLDQDLVALQEARGPGRVVEGVFRIALLLQVLVRDVVVEQHQLLERRGWP